MKSFILTLFLLQLSCVTNFAFCQWEDMNTGLTMDITGVNFDGNVGFVSGEDGIYYTQTGGIGPTSWTPYTITTSTTDSLTYERTVFNHCFSTTTIANDKVFFCGRDTVQNRAVVFSINPTTLAYAFVYIGSTGSSLSHMAYSSYTSRYYAAGDNGLVLSFLANGTGNVTTTLLSDSLISINTFGNLYVVSSGNRLIHGSLNTPGTLTLAYQCYTPSWINDLQASSSSNLNAVGEIYQTAFVNCMFTTSNNIVYDEIPFNGTAILKKGTDWLIGTDHGAYKNINGSIELQPTSNGNHIIDFGEDAVNSNRLYAVCKNGVLLRTVNNGGATKPNIEISLISGGCYGQATYMSLELGSAQSNTITWWRDGVQQTSSIYAGAGILPVGQHTISLTASNGSYSDLASVVFHIVDTPDVTFPFTVLDDILCHKEALVVEFSATEDSVQYVYYNASTNANLGESGELNGGFLSFISDSISYTQPIILEAQSTYATCKQRFLDTIHVLVEHPKAFFHVDLINANPNEQIVFHNQSLEATNFDWAFDGSALTPSSSAIDVINSYGSIGQDSTHLLAWTNNFCYDSISLLSANIFENPMNEDSCWLNKHYSEYTGSSGGSLQPVRIEPSSDGYFAMGHQQSGILGSQFGITDSLNLNGAYLSKYDQNGTLKWQIHTLGINSSTVSIQSTFIKAIENSAGEVYAIGYLSRTLIDNTGDTILMASGPQLTATLIKLDNKGKLLWYRKVTGQSAAWSLGLDQNENVFFIVNDWSNFDQIVWSLSGNPPETVSLPAYPFDAQFCLFKLTPQGNEIWHLPIANDINNTVSFLRVQTDSLNNIYLAGQIDGSVRVFNPGSLTTYNEEIGNRLFLFKLDENGNYIWSVRTMYSNGANYPLDIEVDLAGNSYMTGTRGGTLIFENSNNSSMASTAPSAAKIFIAKINSAGFTQWIKCNSSGYYGGGEQLDLVNDTLFMSCYIGAQSAPTLNTSFTNVDGSAIELTLYEEDRMLVTLDTSGFFYRAVTNGNNFGNPNTAIQLESTGYFRLPNGKNFLSKTLKPTPYLDSIGYDDFGEELHWGQLSSFQVRVGVVNAFYESCDNIYHAKYNSSINEQLCIGSSFTFPSGVQTITQDTSFQLTLTAVNGLDSIVNYSITALPIYYLTQGTNSCWGSTFSFPDGSNSILYSDTLQTSILTGPNGCDIVIQTQVDVPLIDTISVSDLHCYGASYVFPDGSNANLYDDTLQQYMLSNIFGCDSIVQVMVSIVPFVDTTTVNSGTCLGASYTFPDGTTASIYSDTTQYSVLSSSSGCDSVVQTTLYLQNATATVVNVGGMLQANLGATSYQWIDCGNNSILAGETSFEFIYSQNGDYAVILTENNCSDTSNCVTVQDAGIDMNSFWAVEISPNPSTGLVHINWFESLNQMTLCLLNSLGQHVSCEEILNANSHWIHLPAENGVYFIELIIDGYRVRKAIVKMD